MGEDQQDGGCTPEGSAEKILDDHIQMDESTQRRWAGDDVDLRQSLPSDLILAAAEVDPAIRPAIGGYLSMTALPASLRAVEPRARGLYASGWRPRLAPGPSLDELAELVSAARVQHSLQVSGIHRG